MTLQANKSTPCAAKVSCDKINETCQTGLKQHEIKIRVTKRRWRRICNKCEACVRTIDCGICDFCQDKPKFGGSSVKRQKCRWRQCLLFARKHLVPACRDELRSEDVDEWEEAEEWEWERKRKKKRRRRRKVFGKRLLKNTAQRMPKKARCPSPRTPPQDGMRCPFALNINEDLTEDVVVDVHKGLSRTPKDRHQPLNTNGDLVDREGLDSDDSDCIIVTTSNTPPHLDIEDIFDEEEPSTSGGASEAEETGLQTTSNTPPHLDREDIFDEEEPSTSGGASEAEETGLQASRNTPPPLDREGIFDEEEPSTRGAASEAEETGPQTTRNTPPPLDREDMFYEEEPSPTDRWSEEEEISPQISINHLIPSNIEDVLIKGEVAESEEAEGLPVIMEIFSLGSYRAISCWDHALTN